MESTLFSKALSSLKHPYTACFTTVATPVAFSLAEATKPSDLKVLGQDILAGGAAGVVGQAMVFPLYTAKTNLQNNPQVYNRGLLHCMRQIAAKQGVKGLYAGIRPTVTMTFPEKAIKLAANDYFRKKLMDEQGKVTVSRGMLAGAGAGFCQVIVTNPMELLMITMQTRAAANAAAMKKMATTVGADVAVPKVAVVAPQGMISIARELGVRRLYADIPATLLRDIPFSVVFFPLNSYLKEFFTDKDGKTPLSGVLTSGFFAGTTAATLSTPMDVVKTRVMAATGKARPGDPQVSQAVRIVQTFGEVYKASGIRGLFAGTGPRVLIISPLFGITTMVYEFLQKLRESGHL